MTVSVRYVGVAEGIVADGRQAISLVNFDPAFLAFDSFPVQWPLALIAVFESDDDYEGEAGKPFTCKATLYDPDGEPMVSIPAAGTTQPRPFPDLPARFFVGISAALMFTKPGDYRLEITLSQDTESVTGSRVVRVRKKPANPA